MEMLDMIKIKNHSYRQYRKNIKLVLAVLFLFVLCITIFLLIKLLFNENKKNYEYTPLKRVTTKSMTVSSNLEKTFQINSSLKELLINYPELSNILISANIKVPIEGYYVPQGISIMKDYLVISLYDSSEVNNSICYVLDKRGKLINKVNLNNKIHASTLTFDKINELMWITGDNGTLYVYRANDFINQKALNPIYVLKDLSKNLYDYIDRDKRNISNVFVTNDFLYIGNFFIHQSIKLKKYQIAFDEQKNLELSYINDIKLPSKVQGISIENIDGIDYLFLSRSFKRLENSYLEVYKFDKNINDYTLTNNLVYKVEMPPMLEQIAIEDNYVYSIFESGAKKYSDARDIINYICILDINKMNLKK